MPPLPPLPGRRSEDSNRSRGDPTTTCVGRRSFDIPESQRTVRETAPSPIPPRSPLRLNYSSRTSFMSTQTDSTNAPSSLLDNQTSTQFFSTVRTNTTNVTSIYPAAESPFTRSDANLTLFTQSPEEYQTPLTDLPRPSRRSLDRERIPDRLYAIGLNGSTYDVLGGGRRRERRSSELCNNDLSGVEELDEGTRRGGRPGGYTSGSGAEVPSNTDSPARGPVLPQVQVQAQAQARGQPPINQHGHPERLDRDDDSPARRREGNSKDKDTTPRSSLLNQVEIDLSTTPPPSRPSKIAGLPYRRPSMHGHGHRHSVDTLVHPLPLLPRFFSGPQSKNKDLNYRGSSPSGSSGRDSSTPSPGANHPVSPPALVKRNSSRPSPRASYVPKSGLSTSVGSLDLEGPYTSEAAISVPALGRVPFPRTASTASGEHPSSAPAPGPGPASRLGALPSSLETPTQAEMSGNSIPYTGTAKNQYRGRYNSEVGVPRSRRTRPNSFDDGGIKPRRSRYESMVNLVTGSEALTRGSSVHGEIITLVFPDGKEHDYVGIV